MFTATGKIVAVILFNTLRLLESINELLLKASVALAAITNGTYMYVIASVDMESVYCKRIVEYHSRSS
jgi:hypothetical protein